MPNLRHSSVLAQSAASPVAPIRVVARRELFRCGAYRACLAETDAEREAIYRLRFLVFNLELNEGLDSALETGFDIDQFDTICDHIFIQHQETGEVVGTYRLQSGAIAQRHFGFYSASEFDFAPYKPIASQTIELGRACIYAENRSFEVLSLLWRAITWYAMSSGARYLIGCSSLTSQDERLG